MNDQPRVIASISDYPGLIAAMRTRAAERKIAIGSDNSADLAGLPDRYIAKLLGPRPVKRIGMISLGPLLGLLGVRLVMVEDLIAVEALAGRLVERNEGCVRAGVVRIEFSRRFLQKIAREAMAAKTQEQRSAGASKAGRARWKGISAPKRSEAARKAALTRWRKHAKKRGGRCVAEASKAEINQTRLLTHDQET